jgi:hypothetical protein
MRSDVLAEMRQLDDLFGRNGRYDHRDGRDDPCWMEG